MSSTRRQLPFPVFAADDPVNPWSRASAPTGQHEEDT